MARIAYTYSPTHVYARSPSHIPTSHISISISNLTLPLHAYLSHLTYSLNPVTLFPNASLISSALHGSSTGA